MRHRKTTKTLGRKTGPRKALYRGLMTNLIVHEAIVTTEAKAKTIKPMVEKLITKGKVASLHSERELAKVLYTDKAVKKVLEVLGPRYQERPGGYTRITKLGFRQGDGASMVQLEFVK